MNASDVPPLSAYANEPLARSQGNGAGSSIVLRSALEVATQPSRTAWLLKPYVERAAMVLLVGAEGTFKSFLALHWAMQMAMAGEPVVFLSAEGRGLWKRLRAWCLHYCPGRTWSEVLRDLPLVALEKPINLVSGCVLAELTAAIDELGCKPSALIVDTMTRFSDGSVEASNEDATRFLNGLDQSVRGYYGSTILLLHHIGHTERQRSRGPFALIASTDANYLLERPDAQRRMVTVTSGRMKDTEPPAPFELEAHVVTLDVADEDGRAETSLILRPTGNAPSRTLSRPTGRAQCSLLAELERRVDAADGPGIWTEGELREIGRQLGLHRNTARDAVLGLRALGYFTATVGGSRLAHRPGANDRKDARMTETTESCRTCNERNDRESLRTRSFGRVRRRTN